MCRKNCVTGTRTRRVWLESGATTTTTRLSLLTDIVFPNLFRSQTLSEIMVSVLFQTLLNHKINVSTMIRMIISLGSRLSTVSFRLRGFRFNYRAMQTQLGTYSGFQIGQKMSAMLLSMNNVSNLRLTVTATAKMNMIRWHYVRG